MKENWLFPYWHMETFGNWKNSTRLVADPLHGNLVQFLIPFIAEYIYHYNTNVLSSL